MRMYSTAAVDAGAGDGGGDARGRRRRTASSLPSGRTRSRTRRGSRGARRRSSARSTRASAADPGIVVWEATAVAVDDGRVRASRRRGSPASGRSTHRPSTAAAATQRRSSPPGRRAPRPWYPPVRPLHRPREPHLELDLPDRRLPPGRGRRRDRLLTRGNPPRGPLLWLARCLGCSGEERGLRRSHDRWVHVTENRGQTPHRSALHFGHACATGRPHAGSRPTVVCNATVTSAFPSPMRGLTPAARSGGPPGLAPDGARPHGDGDDCALRRRAADGRHPRRGPRGTLGSPADLPHYES